MIAHIVVNPTTILSRPQRPSYTGSELRGSGRVLMQSGSKLEYYENSPNWPPNWLRWLGYTYCWLQPVLCSCYWIFSNHIGDLMVSMFISKAIDCGSEPWSDRTKDCKIGISCFSAEHIALGSKNNDWLARNQDNVSEWSDMSTRGMLFHWGITMTIQLSCWSSSKWIQNRGLLWWVTLSQTNIGISPSRDIHSTGNVGSSWPWWWPWQHTLIYWHL